LPEIFYDPIAPVPLGDGRGAWVLRNIADMMTVMQEGVIYSTEGIQSGVLKNDPFQVLPLEANPPLHIEYRRILAKMFTRSMVNSWSEGIREMAVSLIRGFQNEGECDFTKAFSQRYPVLIFLNIMGMPVAQVDTFLDWEYRFLYSEDAGVREAAAREIRNYLEQLIQERRTQPGDDIVSQLIEKEVDNRKLTDIEILGIGFNLFTGGLDTVSTTLEWIFKMLAENQQLQARLRADKSAMPTALEELLRMFPVIMTERVVTKDTVLNGVNIKAGDLVACVLALANYDSNMFKDPYTADYDRPKADNKHLTFGNGVHHCLGSHLARKELEVAIEEWLDRVPPFRVKDGVSLHAHPGVVGLSSLPLVWDV